MKLSEDPECYWVKISISSREGMYRGRGFFTLDDYAGKIWAKYKNHPKLTVHLQDDNFATRFWESVQKPTDVID